MGHSHILGVMFYITIDSDLQSHTRCLGVMFYITILTIDSDLQLLFANDWVTVWSFQHLKWLDVHSELEQTPE